MGLEFADTLKEAERNLLILISLGKTVRRGAWRKGFSSKMNGIGEHGQSLSLEGMFWEADVICE